jgi:outer membrane murein-binding lipoprotein Lpp
VIPEPGVRIVSREPGVSEAVEVETADGVAAHLMYEIWPGRSEGSKVIFLALQREDGAPPTRVRNGSPAYQKLLKRHPEAGQLAVPTISADEGEVSGSASADSVLQLHDLVRSLAAKVDQLTSDQTTAPTAETAALRAQVAELEAKLSATVPAENLQAMQ